MALRTDPFRNGIRDIAARIEAAFEKSQSMHMDEAGYFASLLPVSVRLLYV
jgi:hypothetical protein